MRTIRRKSRNKTRSIKRNKTRMKTKPTIESQKKLVLSLLREFKWPRTQRPNVVRPSQVEKSEKGGYEGFVLGIVTSWAGKGSRSGYRKMLSMKTREPKYKKLFNETKKLMRLKDPKFKFTSIQYNKNNRAARHRDAKNVGVSYIVGLGDYTGGELIVFDENEKNPVKNDIKDKFYSFNGSKYPHETAPYKGERYTIVFYST
uniref:Prolyl 4-hydroxylase alpha subunit Fe(2+) 2OG dioxygenase domain-containing protein n=1 Tax=viral metagenome TaxID=1070528 RepID=A0A6C0FFT4_9ZZZZ|tara:strand:+ start:18631 stop:19236 length:606 start_codon:yes stop_codon:yes gene_type:complete